MAAWEPHPPVQEALVPSGTVFLLAVGVSADAFAVSVGKGLAMRRFDVRAALALALVLGAFQAVMPLVGDQLGSRLEDQVRDVDHWVVFALLVAVGARMVRGALRPAAEDAGPVLRVRELLALGLATSIDALAVGIGFAFLEVDVAVAVLVIGVTTAVLSFGGVVLGHRAGARWRTPAELLGGVLLIALGTYVPLDHLGVL